jgi:hypothetical protein
MFNVPVRVEVVELGETEKFVDPFPVALALEVITIQEWLLTAVHAQPEEVDTAIAPVPPDALKDWEAGEMEKVQERGTV